jgi:outer membrane protein OmpA-like peptidoglycan-associated protein
MAFGLFGGANFLNHNAKIPYIPGAPDCGYFDKGSALGYYFGILGSYSIINNLLSVDLRLSYDYRPSEFSSERIAGIVYDANNNNYTDMYVEHTHSSSLTYLNFELGVKALPFDKLPLYLRFGFDAGNPLFSSDNTYKIRVVEPEWALFPSGRKEDVLAEGPMNSAGTAMGLSLGLGYEFELNKDFYVAPEISYRYGLNSISSDFDWKTNIIRVGLTAFWAIPIGEKTKQTEPVIIKEKVVEPEKEKIIIVEKPVEKKPEIKIVEPEKNMIEHFSVQDFKLTETIVTQTYPLLLYVFFDEKDTKLKNKYKSDKDIAQFSENNLPTNTLDIYYNLFDIIGNRMKKYPDAKLLLTGTSDGREAGTIEERLAIAEKRARTIKEYLVNRWDISPQSISIQTRDIPELPTSEAYPEGYEENRRVEINSNTAEILAPVIHSKFLEYTSTQKSIIADINLNDENISSWKVTFKDDHNNEIYKKNGYGTPEGNIEIPVNQILIDEAGRVISTNSGISTELEVTNSLNKTESKKQKLDIILSKNQYEVGRLNLIVFDFDKFDISSLNRKLIIDFVKSSISKNSIVRITGGTDRLGEADYNKKLSVERAKSVRKFLRSIKPDINIVEVEGKGASELKYNNDLPEGRFYCRTVMIEIKTPVK